VTDANGCSNTYLDSVCITPPLGVDFVFDRVCNGVPTFFDGDYMPTDDTITSWTWDFGNGEIITTDTDTISYIYPEAGTYYVTLTIENSDLCEKSMTHEVTVDALPGVDFSFTPALCDEPTYFTDLTDPGSGAYITDWMWYFGDDSTSTEQNPIHQYPAIDSTYLVTLVVTNSHGCVDSISYTLEKGICMEALFSVSGDKQCHNTDVCFVDSSYILGDAYEIGVWHWAFGDGTEIEYIHQQDSICHTYDEYGAYTVTLTVTADVAGNPYVATYEQQVNVSAHPDAMMAWSTPCVMAGTQFADLSATNGVDIASWQWTFGIEGSDEDTSSLQNPTWTYTENGTYLVELIVENINGCVDTLQSNVDVFDSPLADFSASLACAGGLTEFTDQSAPAEGELEYWLWDFGTGQTSGEQNPMYVYPDSGQYVVQMIVTDENQCRDTSSTVIQVYPVPQSWFDIIDNYDGIQGQILLDNLSEDAVRYAWDLGNGDTSSMYSPVVLYEENGTYLIELIAWNDNNCPDTSYMEYEVLFQGLYVPTGFTPDSKDPAMKEWKPIGVNLESYTVTVVNQRGNVVFQSSRLDENGSPSEGWDGTVNGEMMSPGTYLWTISARFRDGRVWNGTDAGDGNTNTYGMLLLIR
jgi:PKD repeat protein